jgi:hypothetical protein
MLIRPGQLSLDELQAIHAGGHRLHIDPQALPAIQASAAVVQAAADGNAPVYGVNTGFGKLASTRISQRGPGHAAVEPDPQPQRGRGRAAAGRGGAPDAGAEGGQPGARLQRRAAGGHRHACWRCTTPA